MSVRFFPNRVNAPRSRMLAIIFNKNYVKTFIFVVTGVQGSLDSQVNPVKNFPVSLHSGLHSRQYNTPLTLRYFGLRAGKWPPARMRSSERLKTRMRINLNLIR